MLCLCCAQVVDEFHMLTEHHKQDLFQWLHVNARRLHVLLIANRKDARDEELLEDLRKQSSNIGLCPKRINSFTTRLGRTLVQEVMEKRKTGCQEDILRWMHCCRCLFGGEAVSLRGIERLYECLYNLFSALGSPSSDAASDLVYLLLNKVPTISEATAQEFVTCFLASLDKRAGDAIVAVKNAVRGPVSLMLQAALLTEDEDALGLDFADFVQSEAMKRAYDASPALRIAAWCCQMRDAVRDLPAYGQILAKMDKPKLIFQSAFVDQCGFPLQLEEPCTLGMSECLAFSWGGDYTRMRDIIDAVKHGHSVDWTGESGTCSPLLLTCKGAPLPGRMPSRLILTDACRVRARLPLRRPPLRSRPDRRARALLEVRARAGQRLAGQNERYLYFFPHCLHRCSDIRLRWLLHLRSMIL